MAELRPYPFAALVTRMFREHARDGTIFDLPARKFAGPIGRDLSVEFHGRRAATPLGPAAGPQSQMAQNLVLSWLAGGRIMELKTVQINDQLTIPRPCIDMQTVGYNVEWSQELRLEESLEEYVKGAMLIRMLEASGVLGFPAGFGDTIYDMSVGYDLAGIKSERVEAFMRGMMDATPIVDRLRREIPAEWAHLRDLDFPTRLSDTLTLSTFHGCPPHEIEGIIEHLLEHLGLHSIVKLNPMLLGPRRLRELLHEVMGYEELSVPDTAFERDTKWPEAEGLIGRLGDKAAALGLGFGVKLTNTLIVRNHRRFFPESEKEMYLSGPPLHVLAMNLVAKIRDTFGDRFPISFSAGIDAKNYADAAAIGLVPITVCSDWLKPGGYGRGASYMAEIDRRMGSHATLRSFILDAYGLAGAALDAIGIAGEPKRAALEALAAGAPEAAPCFDAWLSKAKLLNTAHYVRAATEDPRYAAAKNAKVPKKIGRMLVLFDCISCDKCIPVCPNDANFSFVLPQGEVPVLALSRGSEGWIADERPPITIGETHQIANFADFCNECGNCDVFCPEDGGPYVIKPRFFGRREDFIHMRRLDGFCFDGPGALFARFSGRDFWLGYADDRARFKGEGFDLSFDFADPVGTIQGAGDRVDLTYALIMRMVHRAVLEGAPSYVRTLAELG